MKKKKNIKEKNYKISIICEGDMEDIFIKKLKNEIYKSKMITICKKHSKILSGTIDSNNINEVFDCCNCFIIINKDNLDNSKLNELKNKAMTTNNVFILNVPCFEIILLSLFEEVHQYCKKYIEKKLADYIHEKSYKHSTNSLEKIFKKVFKKESEKTKIIEQFEKNLLYINNNGKSNFIVLCKKLKEGI